MPITLTGIVITPTTALLVHGNDWVVKPGLVYLNDSASTVTTPSNVSPGRSFLKKQLPSEPQATMTSAKAVFLSQ